MAGCSQGVREVVKTTGSVAIVGSAISPTGGVIAGATTYIMELMDYDRNSEVPTIKTPEQAIDNTFNYLPFLDLTAFLNKIGLALKRNS
jgi:hypothetical protein